MSAFPLKKPNLDSLERAILETIAYSDIFDYPLKAEEIHRYLIGYSIPLESFLRIVEDRRFLSQYIKYNHPYFALIGREHILDIRRQREKKSNSLWPFAVYYGNIIARFPFVRMVAVTGSLAVKNIDSERDLDYFIVTEPGRLWICRGLIILLVRWGIRRGIVICPNYFLSENALNLEDRSLFTARELTQMVPIAGIKVYNRLRRLNSWTLDILPNALGPPFTELVANDNGYHLKRKLAESVLRTPIGGKIEKWEMERKKKKFRKLYRFNDEMSFTPDRCKGHIDGYLERTLAAYKERLRLLYE